MNYLALSFGDQPENAHRDLPYYIQSFDWHEHKDGQTLHIINLQTQQQERQLQEQLQALTRSDTKLKRLSLQVRNAAQLRETSLIQIADSLPSQLPGLHLHHECPRQPGISLQKFLQQLCQVQRPTHEIMQDGLVRLVFACMCQESKVPYSHLAMRMGNALEGSRSRHRKLWLQWWRSHLIEQTTSGGTLTPCWRCMGQARTTGQWCSSDSLRRANAKIIILRLGKKGCNELPIEVNWHSGMKWWGGFKAHESIASLLDGIKSMWNLCRNDPLQKVRCFAASSSCECWRNTAICALILKAYMRANACLLAGRYSHCTYLKMGQCPNPGLQSWQKAWMLKASATCTTERISRPNLWLARGRTWRTTELPTTTSFWCALFLTASATPGWLFLRSAIFLKVCLKNWKVAFW